MSEIQEAPGDQPKVKGKPGRPVGSMNKLTREAIDLARRTGRLPHEILLDIARGDIVRQKVVDHETGEVTHKHLVPSLEQRIDAAKAAAPYYAPKISTVEVISGVADDELNHLIALAAAEAGLSLTLGGEGEEGEGGEGEAGGDAVQAREPEGRPGRRRARLDAT